MKWIRGPLGAEAADEFKMQALVRRRGRAAGSCYHRACCEEGVSNPYSQFFAVFGQPMTASFHREGHVLRMKRRLIFGVNAAAVSELIQQDSI